MLESIETVRQRCARNPELACGLRDNAPGLRERLAEDALLAFVESGAIGLHPLPGHAERWGLRVRDSDRFGPRLTEIACLEVLRRKERCLRIPSNCALARPLDRALQLTHVPRPLDCWRQEQPAKRYRQRPRPSWIHAPQGAFREGRDVFAPLAQGGQL